MKYILVLLFAVLCAQSASAITDPLSSQFQPSIDTTASNYYVALGTITITDSLYKVFQSSVAPGDVHWFSGPSAYMMQNEILSFQVHVTPKVNIASLTVSMSNLTNAQTGTVISSNTSDIVVYREFYMNIATPTSIGSSYYNFRARMPDQLIPAKEPYYHQTTNAFPSSVTANNTQSVWFDIHCPTSAPSGYYQGSVYVSSGNVVVSTMPVVIGVWAWLMPSSTTLRGAFQGFDYNGFCNVAYNGNLTNCGTYPGGGGGSDHANTLQWVDGTAQALDNRVTIYNPSNIYPEAGSFATYVSTIGPLLNGTTTNVVQTILPGAAMTTAVLQPLSFTSSVWQNWVSTFSVQGWLSRLNWKLCDEPPNGCTWAQLISSGTASRSYSTPIVPNLVTTDSATASANGALYVIDWITPVIDALDSDSTGNHRSEYNYFLSLSSGVTRRIGSYLSCDSSGHNACTNGVIGDIHGTWPNRAIDGLPVANRAFETWAYLNNLNFEHYFASDYCDTSNCPTTINPWVSVYAFGENGGGELMYPSTTTYVTTSSNIPIWVPSIRLKHIRDGFQDYEYAYYLNAQGRGTIVSTQIATWMTNGYTFNTSPTTFQAARFAMGQAIHQLTYPTTKVLKGGGRYRGGGSFR